MAQKGLRTFIFNKFKQPNDYTCGPAALAFFLHFYGIKVNVLYLTVRLKTTEDGGTSHFVITKYLKLVKFPFTAGALSLQKIQLPMLVNYFDGEDGHYGVLMRMETGSVEYFDPADGGLHAIAWSTFLKSWWSPRYGKHWGLCKKLDLS